MKTILVVDDEFAITDALADLLTDEGYRVITADTGAQGLERLRAEVPDLMLLDLMMPVVDGWKVLEAMQADPGLKEVPVIVMSAGPPRFKGEITGARAFLHKPFRLDLLLQKIDQVLPAQT